VLTAPGISVILKALDESRKIFGRMTSYATYRIAETIRIILFMALSIIVFGVYPLTTLMIILLALLNDLPIMMIAYDNAYSSDKPVRWEMNTVLGVATMLGLLGVTSSFILYAILKFYNVPLELIQTTIFLKMMVAGHLTLYLTRSTSHHFWHRPYPAPRLFWTTELTQAAATLFAGFGILVPQIPWAWCGIVWIYALSWFCFNNFVKVGMYKLVASVRNRHGTTNVDLAHHKLHAPGEPYHS
jgi:H+-transporting ATPase